ncbi:MAG: hypothetical protein QOJ76_1976 [Acidobacteriota bacterium]|jgi:hypothetical protein|nr:hypothetical protein [Acidobacteriota bacterium]
MKEGFDKEIDLLLRRRARGGASVRAGVDGASAAAAGAHLDADELGAFAEGALPAPARFAAVSHLADCDACRAVVVGLARVSEVGAESEKHAANAVNASTGATAFAAWRAWTASLFAPRVLRFVAPALALSVVAVVSFVALRSKSGTQSDAMQVATSEGRRDAAPKNEAGDAASMMTETANASANMSANANGVASQTTDNAAQSQASANTSAPLPSGRGGHGTAEATPAVTETKEGDEASAPQPPPPAASVEGERASAKAAPRPVAVEAGEVAKPDNAKTDNKEKSARRAEPADETASNDQPEQQQKRSGQSRANEVQMPDGSRNQTRSPGNSAANAAGGALTSSAPRAADRDSAASRAPAAKRGRPTSVEGADENDAFLAAEGARSAAGHRFRRERGAWVDVNYKPSMSSTGVSRGTEAFRALVADIPEIGRVAEQIGGEVVVVIRGHAYRVR